MVLSNSCLKWKSFTELYVHVLCKGTICNKAKKSILIMKTAVQGNTGVLVDDKQTKFSLVKAFRGSGLRRTKKIISPCLSVYLSFCLSVFLSFCFSFCLSFWISVSLFFLSFLIIYPSLYECRFYLRHLSVARFFNIKFLIFIGIWFFLMLTWSLPCLSFFVYLISLSVCLFNFSMSIPP